MRERIKRLVEERAGIWNQMTDVIKEAESRDGGLSGELQSRYEQLEKDLDAKTAEIDLCQRHLEKEARLAAPAGEGRPTPAGAADHRGDVRSLGEREDYAEAFEAMLRGGLSRLNSEQRDLITRGFSESRDLGVATGAAGGYLVPQGFLTKITERLKYYGPMRNLANTIETSSGNAMPWPNNDDTGNVATILSENTSVTLTDIALTSKTLNSYVWATGDKASLQLLNDSAFDVEGFLAKKFGQRFGRGQNNKFTQGSGTGEPLGILNGGTPPVAGQIITLATGNATSFSSTAVAINGLLDTQHALDRAYRVPGPSTGWMMNDLVLKAIRKLTDSQGRPIWIPEQSYGSITSGAQGELFGFPVFANNDMDVQTASKYTVAFGDWSSYYIIRDVVGIQMLRLDERYADQLQVGFLAFMRSDGKIDDAYAASFLQQSAT